MARHSSGSKGRGRSLPRPVNRKEGTMKRWNKPEDIPMDEEDQFHAARDRILLEGEDLRSDDEGDEEEVFALDGVADDSDDSQDEGHAGEDEEDEDEEYPEPGPSTKKSKKGKKGAKAPATSDEESGSEEEEEGWGRSKAAYYSSNAGQLESDDEEANELEEQEARRLQAKARDTMTDEDFGLGDFVEGDIQHTDDLIEPATPVIQKLPEDRTALLRHLEKTNPEALALAGDWDDAARSLIKTQSKIALLEGDDTMDKINTGMLHLYYQSLLQYATTLAFFLYLRASEKYAHKPELLRSHPIMTRLLTFKQSIATLEDLGVTDSDVDDDSDLDDDSSDELGLGNIRRGISAAELQSLLADMEQISSATQTRSKSLHQQPASEDAKPKAKKAKKAVAVREEPPKKKRKTAAAKPALPVFDLEEPEFPAKPKAASRASRDADTDAYGELTALQDADAKDKAARKKTLRFHTSRIESSSARRERARTMVGGDDDIPWKERKREQEARNKKELQKTRGMGGEDLDGEEPEPRAEAGKKRRRDEDSGSGSDADDGDGYYELVQRKSKEKKEKKKAEYDAARAIEKEDLVVEDSANGPRSVSRAMLKNRGLTPHRAKSVRNPRVKKRQRYEKAKKKVSSQKAVYKGGLAATGRYDGEKSGISKVIKSVRL